jgi:nucleoid-associated protein YgaU
MPYVPAMHFRLLALALLAFALDRFDPAWIVIEWSNPTGWVRNARPEDAAAAMVRVAALSMSASQAAALSLVWVGRMNGSGGLERGGRRFVIPALRAAAPLALVAGSAIPAAATETRLPVTLAQPAPSERMATGPRPVRVEAGESMWTIAAAHTAGELAPFWREVVELNRDRFDDVDLIHPGDIVLLPPLNAAG